MDYKEIKALKAKFEEVPGTYLFNADRFSQGYWLNTFCSTMSKEENRKAFRSSPPNSAAAFSNATGSA